MLVLIRFGITVSIAKDVKVFLIFLKFGLENFFLLPPLLKPVFSCKFAKIKNN